MYYATFKLSFRLYKSLYGLKQSHHDWFEKFSLLIISVGFLNNYHNLTLFDNTQVHVKVSYPYM